MTEDVAHRANARIVVIGAGQAGFSACAKLRALGHAGSLTLVGEENDPPYQRPPLSKGYLLGDMAREQLFLRPPTFYIDQGIDLRAGLRATRIDRRSKTVDLADGASLPYDKLILATGSRPRVLPDALCARDLAGLYYIRNLADADALAPEFRSGRRVLVIGGGYIGLEVAAAASKHGLKVTLLEETERILRRVAAPETSNRFRALHRAHGVEIRENCALRFLSALDGRVSEAILSDGTALTVDLVIAGIGVLPNQELAAEAGLQIDNGIRVDALCRTSDPEILAAGDCASFPFNGARIRLESVGNAIDQAEAVAAVVMGSGVPYEANPWFWSDQYDVKLQIAGLSTGYDTVVTRQSVAGAISFWYFRGRQLLAVDAMNDPRAYMLAKRLMGAGQSPDPGALADPATDLKSLLKF